MASDDRMYVGHILDAIGKVDTYLIGQDAEVFGRLGVGAEDPS